VREKMRADAAVRKWLALPDEDIERFLARLPMICALTPGKLTVRGVVKDDPDDDMLFAAALESGAQYVISEDRHVRKLKLWHGIRTMNREAFMTELDRLDMPQAPQPQ
jgi:predicted nucleic acid-binding protein